MTINIDEKDKKIFAALSRDATLSFADIEKETNIPRHIVVNRIKKLEESKIIKGHKLNINYRLLGFEEFEVHLRLMSIDKAKTLEIIRDIEKNPNVTWIGSCFGNYDLKINIFAKTNSELYALVHEMLKAHNDFIKGEEISSITKKHKTDKTTFLRCLLDDDKINSNEKITKEQNLEVKQGSIQTAEQIKLDHIDLTIIKHLGKNPRIKLTELSKKTNLTVQGVKNRIDSLKKRKVILGSTALINGQALGHIWATCLFKMTLNEKEEEMLEKHIYALQNTSSAVRLIGKWDLGITFFDKSVREIQERINEFKGLFKDNIKDYDSFIILDIYKYPELPECIFERERI